MNNDLPIEDEEGEGEEENIEKEPQVEACLKECQKCKKRFPNNLKQGA